MLSSNISKIAIIGAGFSGSLIYNLLKKENHNITLFEKARGVGGRCSSKYINDKFIDHGAPFFQINDLRFEKLSHDFCKKNILRKQNNIYYPTNGIDKICFSLINEEDLIKNTKVVSCKYTDKKWNLSDESGITYDQFDILIITIPATQIIELDIDLKDEIKEKLANVTYNSVATLIAYNYNKNDYDFTTLSDSKIFKKIINNSSKYNYEDFSSFVFHLHEEITNKEKFLNKEDVKKYLLSKIYEISNIDLEKEFQTIPHFWKYAFVSNRLEGDFIYDCETSLGICGDFFGNSNLESSFMSSKSLYKKIAKI